MPKPRLYTHHHTSSPLPVPGRGPAFVSAVGRTLFNICYAAGAALYFPARRAVLAAARDVRLTAARLPEHLSRLGSGRLRSALGVLLLVAVTIPLVGLSGRLTARGLEVKERILGASKDAAESLAEAAGASSGSPAEAQLALARALQSFGRAEAEIADAGSGLRAAAALLPPGRAAGDLLEAGSLGASAGQDLLSLLSQLGSLKLTGSGLSTPVPLDELAAGLSAASEKLSRASSLAAGALPNLPGAVRERAAQASAALTAADRTLAQLSGLGRFLARVLSGHRTVLVLLTNTNELRSGGGFIGSYGAATVNDGQLERLKISSVYDLDGQIGERIAPPSPLLNVNDRWYMRDSNWFVDFRQSARAASGFFEKAGGETPDLVVAVSPEVIEQLLEVTGPVTAGAPPVTYSAENFFETVEAATTRSTGLPTNEPKQALADLFAQLLKQLGLLPRERAAEAILRLERSLAAKKVVLFSRDAEAEQFLERYGWAGAVRATDRDSLTLASANLGGTKTDRFITQTVSLVSSVGPDGSVTDELTITRRNRLPAVPESENVAFIRALVPKGSELLESAGFDLKTLPAFPSENLTEDPAVHAWEAGSRRDVLTGTTVGTESGRTFFGNWLTLQGGEERTVRLRYRLPFTLAAVDRLSLLSQLQVGGQPYDLSYRIDYPKRGLAWKNFGTDGTETLAGTLNVSGDAMLGAVITAGGRP